MNASKIFGWSGTVSRSRKQPSAIRLVSLSIPWINAGMIISRRVLNQYSGFSCHGMESSCKPSRAIFSCTILGSAGSVGDVEGEVAPRRMFPVKNKPAVSKTTGTIRAIHFIWYSLLGWLQVLEVVNMANRVCSSEGREVITDADVNRSLHLLNENYKIGKGV